MPETLVGEDELILTYKLKKDTEGIVYTFIVRSTKQEDLGVNFSRTGTLKRYVFVEPSTPANQTTSSPPVSQVASLQVFDISLGPSQVAIPPSIGDQLKQIYNSLQKPANLASATTDWDMLIALYNATLPVCLEISLKLLINLTAEEANQLLICNDDGIMKRAISIFEASEVKIKEVAAWFIANLSVNTNNLERLGCHYDIAKLLLPMIQITNGTCPYSLKVKEKNLISKY
jgi:hypothetical protein